MLIITVLENAKQTRELRHLHGVLVLLLFLS